jgi:hypothetical protein
MAGFQKIEMEADPMMGAVEQHRSSHHGSSVGCLTVRFT